MHRFVFRAVVLLFVLGWVFHVEGKAPNVLIVVADQWRAQAFGYAGDPNVKTPNFDRFAGRSVDFTHAVSGTPVCSPFRASLLTGQRGTTHGIFLNDAHLDDNAVTLAKVLRDSGYDTGIIGKWHLNGGGRLHYIPKENRQGFDYWKVMECTHEYNESLYFADDDTNVRQWEGYDAFAQTKDAQAYIAAHAKNEKPFLLCLWWGPPHSPYQTAPEKYKKMYDPAKIELRPNVPKAMTDAAKKDLAGYYAHCTALDDAFGDLWKTLQDSGIEDETIVIFTSDHGDMHHSNGFIRKQKPWDESIRTPMLWHFPKSLGSDGKKLDVPMSSEDILPTLLSLCGVSIPKTVEGLDYSGHMKGGENPNPDNAALIECVSPFGEWTRAMGGKEMRGIRTTRYTYVRDLKGPWLLYDNESDPYQMKNLIDDPASADVRKQLDDILNKKLVEAKDEFKPADYYLTKFGYKDRLNKNGTLSTAP